MFFSGSMLVCTYKHSCGYIEYIVVEPELAVAGGLVPMTQKRRTDGVLNPSLKVIVQP